MREYPFHVGTKIMSRSKGHNAVAAAAYRAGETLAEDLAANNGKSQAQRKPIFHDYSRRHGVMSNFIIAPKDAPHWAKVRADLWNKVEKSEKRVDAQVAREVVVSLPDVSLFDHFNAQDKAKYLQKFYENILRDYVKANFTNEGMIADVGLHEPAEKNDKRNYHAHIMLTMRRLDSSAESGFGAKERRWNDKKQLEKWRVSFAQTVNTALAKHNIPGFIDHRSHAARGLDILPTTPIGKKNHKYKHFGSITKAANENIVIQEKNRREHKYLERLFEHEQAATRADIVAVISKQGFDEDPEKIFDRFVQDKALLPLYSRETGQQTEMYQSAAVAENMRQTQRAMQAVHDNRSFALSLATVQKAVQGRGDKMVREALSYTAESTGFKVIEAANNGHKKTYLGAVHDLYKQAGYDVVSVARNNKGKDAFYKAGIKKSVITYRDLLRRYGARYTGEKSTSQKIIVIDEADQLSPQQDQEIFAAAQKVGAKLVYVGDVQSKDKRLWKSQFNYYKHKTAAKSLRHAFTPVRAPVHEKIVHAFRQARTHEALRQQAKYIHARPDDQQLRLAVLEKWYKGLRKTDDKRFIYCAAEQDAIRFNNAIQKERVARKHLDESKAQFFTSQYKTQASELVKRELCLYAGDMIQFKRGYKDIGIQEGTRARVLTHNGRNTALKTDDGRYLNIPLNDYKGFDLGYAGTSVSYTRHTLNDAYIYHSQGAKLDHALALYEKTKKPPRLFYNSTHIQGIKSLANAVLSPASMAQGLVTHKSEEQKQTNHHIAPS